MNAVTHRGYPILAVKPPFLAGTNGGISDIIRLWEGLKQAAEQEPSRR